MSTTYLLSSPAETQHLISAIRRNRTNTSLVLSGKMHGQLHFCRGVVIKAFLEETAVFGANVFPVLQQATSYPLHVELSGECPFSEPRAPAPSGSSRFMQGFEALLLEHIGPVAPLVLREALRSTGISKRGPRSVEEAQQLIQTAYQLLERPASFLPAAQPLLPLLEGART